jgi:hypothetical protein
MPTARYTKKHSARKAAVRRECQGRSVAALHRAAGRAVFGRAAMKASGGIKVPAMIPETGESAKRLYEVKNIKTGKSIEVEAIDPEVAKQLAIEAKLARKVENLETFVILAEASDA